jgi:hypothetical protein
VNSVPDVVDYAFGLLPAIAFVVVLVRSIYFAMQLRSQGVALRPHTPLNAVFSETGVRGSLSGSWHRSVSGSGLTVWVTPQECFISLPFPLNVLAYSFRQPFNWVLSISQIERRTNADARLITLLFKYPDGRTTLANLRLRDPGKLPSVFK